MTPIPDQSVALAFTSPPYNVGKDYDDNMSLENYLALIRSVADEVYRVLRPGGRYVVNIANLGANPTFPCTPIFMASTWPWASCRWAKLFGARGKGANGSCAGQLAQCPRPPTARCA